MAQPTPYLVSPSTTFVQVDILQNPYTPVILNNVSYPGQTVSVLDGTSSISVIQEPILISTAYSSLFNDGTFSTLINQPQGFVTVQTKLPNIWSFLNSFPFRNQYLSAGALNVTTTSMNTAVISTLFESVSSVVTENLLVTGTFLQSTGVQFNTNLSSFGIVSFTSTLSIYESVFFSTQFSTLGAVYFYSNVEIQDVLLTRSNIQTLSSMYISGSVFTLSNISAPVIRLQDSLVGIQLEVQQSTGITTNVANSILVNSNISTLSTINVGGNFDTNTIRVYGNAFFQSSISVTSGFTVTGTISFSSILSSLSNVAIGSNLGVSGPAIFVSTIYENKNIVVNDTLSITSKLSTQNADIINLNVQSNFLNNTFSTSIFGISSLSNLGIGNANVSSISIGDLFYINSNLSFLASNTSTYIGSTFITLGTISSLQSTFIEDYASVDALSTLKSLYVMNSTFLDGNVTIGGILNTNILNSASTVVEGNLSLLGNFQVQGTIVINTISLVSSVLAKNFVVSTLETGYEGLVSSAIISTLFTSSLRVGGVNNSEYTADISVPFNVISSYALYVSSSLINLSGPTASTYLNVMNSFAINTEPVPNQTTISGSFYTNSSINILENVSTLHAVGTFVGTHIGDGSLLTDISYPKNLEVNQIYSSTIFISSIQPSIINASTGTVYTTFYPTGPIFLDGFSIYGISTNFVPTTSTNYLIAVSNANIITSKPTVTLLNNIKIYGGTQTPTSSNFYEPGQVNINEWALTSNIIAEKYTLAVGGTLRVSTIESSSIDIPYNSYRADVFIVNPGPNPSAQLYLSSGYFTSYEQNPYPLLVGESHPIISSVIQPYQSTLILNNTVYIDGLNKRVGIFTSTPNFTLDGANTILVDGSIQFSTLSVSEEIRLNSNVSSYWYLGQFGKVGVNSNLWSSKDGENWIQSPIGFPANPFLPPNSPTSPPTSLAYNGSLWVAMYGGGFSNIWYYDTTDRSKTTWTAVQKVGINPITVSWNGTMFLAFGLGVPESNTIIYSYDGKSWNNANGGFPSEIAIGAGRAMAWNGNMWVGVGTGASNLKFQTSLNGINWFPANLVTGTTSSLTGVAWAGKRWIATQNLFSNFSPSLNHTILSDDGSNWYPGGQDHFYSQANAVAYNGKMIVAVGDAPPSLHNSTIQYSYDYGNTWNVSQGVGFSTIGFNGIFFPNRGGASVAWNGSYWLAGGEDGIRKSYDGVNWFVPTNQISTTYSLGFTSNNPTLSLTSQTFFSSISKTRWLVGGQNNPLGDPTVRYSDNGGSSWTSASNGLTSNTNALALDPVTKMWVAVGRANFGSSTISYSYDNGVTWEPEGTGLAEGRCIVKGAGSRWVCGGANSNYFGFGNPSTLFYAENTSTSNWSKWTAATFNSNISRAFTYRTNGLAFDGASSYVAVGADSNNFNSNNYGLLYSSDGISWSTVTNAFQQSGPGSPSEGNGVIFASSIFVAVGRDFSNNHIKYSYNGYDWSNANNGGFTFASNVFFVSSSLWVVSGFDPMFGASNTKYSTDLNTWTNYSNFPFSNQNTNIAYDSLTNTWMATGSFGFPMVTATMAFSGDGTSWTYSTEKFTQIGGPIAYNNYTQEIEVGNSKPNALSFYRDLIDGVQYQISTSFISYNASTLSLNNTLIIDEKQNIFIGGYPSTTLLNASNFNSSLIVSGVAFISTFTSTIALKANNLRVAYSIVS